MTGPAAVVLAALLLDHALDALADVLNVRALGSAVPAELRTAFDAERYRRAQAYTRARTRLDLVASTFGLAATLAFWLAGGFGWLDRAVRSLGLGAVATGLLFLASLGLARVGLGLPFAWWGTFVVEERFGFNRTTARTFWADRAKGLVLAAVLGGPLLAVVLWLFARIPGTAWLWCWGVSAVATIILQHLAPTWILPLFNRFSPLPEGPLREAILTCARACGYPLGGVWVIDGSRRSTKANAFFTGFGRRKRIALYDTLIATLDPAAVVAVVAHEIGHYRRGHVVQGTAVAVLHLGLLFFLLSLVLRTPALFVAFGVEQPSAHVGIVIFGLLLAPLERLVSVALNAWSRRNEREADRFALETSGSAEALVRGLLRLAADSLANLTPHPLYVALHYTHPPLAERVRALARWAPAGAPTPRSPEPGP